MLTLLADRSTKDLATTFKLVTLFKSNYEVAGRYTRVMPLSGMASNISHGEQFTLGLSKYVKGHNLKTSD